LTALLTPAEVAATLRVRDRRTVRRRLRELGVPTIPAGRSYRVRPEDLARAVAAAVVVPGGDHGTHLVPEGARLAPGERLWDDPPASQAGRRRANAPAQGTRELTPVQRQPNNGIPAVPVALSRALSKEETRT